MTIYLVLSVRVLLGILLLVVAHGLEMVQTTNPSASDESSWWGIMLKCVQYWYYKNSP
jgi:hypothetical protein